MAAGVAQFAASKLNRLLSLAALFCWLPCAACAWEVVSCNRETSSVPGVEYWHVALEENTATTELEVALFSIKAATLHIVDQPTEARSDLAELMRRNNCLAGVNGGYFDPQDAPVGLLVSGGRAIAPLRKARLLSGVLMVANGRVQLLRTAEFSPKSKPSEALQCGPFLVERGQPVPGLEATRSARRTFVATSGNGRVAIGYCPEATLAQLAQMLAVPELKFTRALNLDGGSSSAFWFARKEGTPFSIPEQKSVRDFIGIVAR